MLLQGNKDGLAGFALFRGLSQHMVFFPGGRDQLHRVLVELLRELGANCLFKMSPRHPGERTRNLSFKGIQFFVAYTCGQDLLRKSLGRKFEKIVKSETGFRHWMRSFSSRFPLRAS